MDVRHVHDVVGQPALLRGALRGAHGALGVDALRRRHVQALGGAKPRIVVERLEVHFFAARALTGDVVSNDAGGAVGFVGDGEVEGRRIVQRLRLAHPAQRVVGAEDGLHAARRRAQTAGDLGRFRNHVAHQRIRAELVALAAPAGGAVRTHDERGHRPRPMRQPLAAGLRHQGDGRRREQNPAIVRHQTLGQPQRRERLAGAARHHQLAAGVALGCKPVIGRVDGLLLQRLRMPQRARLLELQDRVIEEVQKVDAHHPRLPPIDRPLGSRVPSAGGNNPAQSERRPGRLVQEAVDLRLADHRVFGIALALDGHHHPIALHRHQVDAVIAPVQPRHPLPRRPIPPRPNLRHIELGVVPHRRHEQMLEPPPLLRLAGGFAANAGKHVAHTLIGAEVEGGLGGGHELDSQGRRRRAARPAVVTVADW